MALHVGSPKDTTRELLELISALGTVAGYKLMPRNLPHVYTLATKGQKGRGGGGIIKLINASKRIKDL